MACTVADIRKLWKSDFIKDVRREISVIIEPLRAELLGLSKRMDEIETSCKFLSSKYDTLLSTTQDLKKHNHSIDQRVMVLHRNKIIQETRYLRTCCVSTPLNNMAAETQLKFKESQSFPTTIRNSW